MRRPLFLITLMLMAPFTLALLGAPAAAEAAYYETTVVTDAPDDFSTPGHNGALDIVAVHVSERYSLEIGGGAEIVAFRVELRSRSEFESFQGQVPIQYTVGYKIDGQEATHTATMSQTCSPSATQGISCTQPAVEKPHFTSESQGIVFVLVRDDAGLARGGTLTDVWAASATVGGDATVVYQDVAPEDNAGQPHGSSLAVSEFGGPYALQGTFPFFTMERLSPHHRPVVPGGEAEYKFRFQMHESFSTLDRIILTFDRPTGWGVEPNLGTDFVMSDGGQEVELVVTVKSPALAAVGDAATITMDASLLQLGGHASTSFAAEVTGSKVSMPDYEFTLATTGPFQAGEVTQLQTSVLQNGDPLTRYRVHYDFVLDGTVAGTVRAEEVEEGLYQASYSFPSAGDWKVEVYVAELQPSPAQTFDVKVSGGGDSPATGLLAVLLAALVGVALRRRR